MIKTFNLANHCSDFLNQYCHNYKQFLIAYSGGLDSTVLLQSLVHWRNEHGANIKLHAIHINHGINPFSEQWSKHCQKICEQLAIPFSCRKLSLKLSPGDSIEAIAREARYQIFSEYMTPETCLMTAHHQDDQAETVLLQLLRGSGVKGLSAMALKQKFASGSLCRPWLTITREQLRHYAEKNALKWIEDDSNENTALARNYLRLNIMPVLRQRWPAMARSFLRSARHCSQAQILLDELAEQDLKPLVISGSNDSIDCSLLLNLSISRQCNIIRFWLSKQRVKVPNEKKLLVFLRSLSKSAHDKNPELSWDKHILVRNNHQLYLLDKHQHVKIHEQTLKWDLTIPLELPNQLGCLILELDEKGGIDPSIKHSMVTIRFRQGGERIQLPGYSGRKSLKKLMQEWGIPVWQRALIPLLYSNEELVSVVGYCIAQPFVVSNQPGLMVKIQSFKMNEI